jgi:putative ABC transport system permease protein
MRTALRLITRTPWFTATAVLTIALGLGTNVAILSVVEHVLFGALPYDDPDELVWISTWNAERGQYSKSSVHDYGIWRNRTDLFDAVGAFWDRAYTITSTEHTEGVVGWQFTTNLFSMLGTRAAVGRTFTEEDGQPGTENLVVLSDELWRRRFGAREDIAGTTVTLDGRPHVIAGVMPREFTHPYPHTQLWTPVTFSNAALEDRKQRPLRVIARLRDGVTREQAQARLATIAADLARTYPDTHAGFDVAVRPLRDFYIGDVGRLLWMLQAAGVILLLIASSNVASLVLVRATSRQQETAVRVALGARRLDLLRSYLAEGMTLTALGASCGLLLAMWGTHLLPRLLATRLQTVALPTSAAEWLDARVLIAAATATLIIGLVFGVTPLLHRSEASADGLRAGGRGSTGDRRTTRIRNAIVIAQVALAVVLLVGAGLLLRSFARLHSRSFGFETADIVTAQLLLPRDRYSSPAQSAAFLSRLVAEVSAVPGAEAVAAVNTLPLTGSNALRPHHLPGQPPQERFAEFRIVTPDYFRAMAIPLRRGRPFDDRDRIGAQDVIIVNETAARRLWPGVDAVGQTLMVPDGLTYSPKQVVGVVGDTRHHDLSREPEPEIYRPAYQAYWPFFGLVVKTRIPPDLFERSLRDAAARVDRTVPLSGIQPFTSLAGKTWEWRRSSMLLVMVFALAACLLAFVGVYGVMAYGVVERRREIGVRMALGAGPADVARAVAARGACLTGIGLGIGLIGSVLLSGIFSTFLFGIAAGDPPTFAAVAIVTASAGFLASILPALTALGIDPASAVKE